MKIPRCAFIQIVITKRADCDSREDGYIETKDRFGVQRKRRRNPRISFGCLVVQRQSWQFDLGELADLAAGNDADAFRRVRRWRRAHALPSSVFAKLPSEIKPMYFSFDSPVFARNFLREMARLREAGHSIDCKVTLSEMLPSFDQLWLRDQRTHAYTSELRMVAMHRDDVKVE